jgi:hypothetical protein
VENIKETALCMGECLLDAVKLETLTLARAISLGGVYGPTEAYWYYGKRVHIRSAHYHDIYRSYGGIGVPPGRKYLDSKNMYTSRASVKAHALKSRGMEKGTKLRNKLRGWKNAKGLGKVALPAKRAAIRMSAVFLMYTVTECSVKCACKRAREALSF